MATARTFVKYTLLVATLAAALSCGSPPPPPPPKQDSSPQWADVFEKTPDIYGVIRIQALKRDPLYGSFWKSLMRVAEARGFTRGATMVEAVEGSDEIIIGLARGDDAALILRNVPANLDLARMNDADGHPLFHQVSSERVKIPEFEILDRRSAEGLVFVLPDRTWVGTLGAARDRARRAFVTPLNRPSQAPKIEADVLVAVRLGGPLLRLIERHPTYGPVAKKLTSATATLLPNKGGLVIALDYADADATAWGEMQTKRLAADIIAKDEKMFAWLKEAKIAYEGNTVYVRVALPPRLLEELPKASGADIGL